MLNQLLKINHTQYILLDERFCLLEMSHDSGDFISENLPYAGDPVSAFIPELVGMESTMQEVLSGKRNQLRLPYINKGEAYYNCVVERNRNDTKQLLLFFTRVDNEARLNQQIHQQQNEIRILEARLNTKSAQATGRIIGQSPIIEALKTKIARIAQIEYTTVLLLGETGTGKSFSANIIHNAAKNSAEPFVEINCAAIPENLLESELFGSTKGAFTHAVSEREGLIAAANKGTLFLDEISEMPLSLQSKLLTFLETRKFRKLGSHTEQAVQVRIIAASNKDLEQSVSEGSFRADLFYRLNVVPLHLPALREMEQDIVLLAEHFILNFNRQLKKQVKGLRKDAKEKLLKYNWPGNVRELNNVIEQAMIFAENGLLTASDIVLRNRDVQDSIPRIHIPEQGVNLAEVEKMYLLTALEITNGNKVQAAKLLGLSRDTLRYRLSKFNL